MFLAGLCALGPACADGESGLVLGRAPTQGGGASSGVVSGVSAGQAGELSPAGGTLGVEPIAGAGAGGEAGGPPNDGWVEELCSPAVAFDNQTPMGDGKAFDDAVPRPEQLLWTATRAVCRTLFRDPTEVTALTEVSLTVGPFEGGVAGTGDRAIILSDAYLRSRADAGEDVLQEISGIVHFQSSFLYQNGGRPEDSGATRWVRYGIADFVRLRAGYLSRGATAPAADSWSTSSSQTVAFFFDYLSLQHPDVVHGLNQRLAPTETTWSDEAFVALTGKDLPTLWDAYRATF